MSINDASLRHNCIDMFCVLNVSYICTYFNDTFVLVLYLLLNWLNKLHIEQAKQGLQLNKCTHITNTSPVMLLTVLLIAYFRNNCINCTIILCMFGLSFVAYTQF